MGGPGGVLCWLHSTNYYLTTSFYCRLCSPAPEVPACQTFLPSYQHSGVFLFTFFPAYTQKTLNIIIPTTSRTEGIHLHCLTFMSSFCRQQIAPMVFFGNVKMLNVSTKMCGNAISLTILRWHQVQTPHRATSQTAHTTDATDTRNTLRDTEPEGERRRGDRQRHTEASVSSDSCTRPVLGG